MVAKFARRHNILKHYSNIPLNNLYDLGISFQII